MLFAYPDDVERLRQSGFGAATLLAGMTTLEHILNWLQREQRSLATLDMVAQDEYCHDLLLPWSERERLVFGMT